MKKRLRVPSLLFLIIIISILFQLGVLGAFVFSNVPQNEYIHIRTYSEKITFTDGNYHMDNEIKNEIDTRNLFAFIIAQDGNVVWEYHKPTEIKNHFTLTEVASISRWYLDQYPVSVWTREDGLLVLGSLENHLWKYNMTMEISQIKTLVWLIPLALVMNFLIVFLICYKITNKWQSERDLARTEWVAAVSHDIRTPLSMVLGYSDSLQNDKNLTEKEREKLSIISYQSAQIKKSLENINLVNRLDYAEETKANESFSILKAIRQVVADKINGGLDDTYTFDLHFEEPFLLKGDAQLFQRLIDNIISNCIKHNPKGTRITISAVRQKKKLFLTIADRGIGFADLTKANQKIEKGFVFADDSHRLGLAIIKKIVNRFHGKVIFSNDSGARVTLILK